MAHSNKTYEVSFQTSLDPVAGACVMAALENLGVVLSDIVEQVDCSLRKISVFLPSLSLARNLRRRALSLKMAQVKIFIRTHRKEDWQTRWKKGWKPFALTLRIYVIPRFIENACCPKGKVPLYLDTTAAFGTGLHETTRFSAQLIEMCKGGFSTFLDIGTGSGILVAVALLSGARKTAAFDIDPDAVVVARNNLKVNGLICDDLCACDVQNFKVKKRYDLVAANLITHDLVAFKNKIVSCVAPGGNLIISGISIKNMPLVRKTYNKSIGLKMIKVVQGKEWSAFLFERVHDTR